MGVVISSVVAAGPAVLEDLETPYAVVKERKNKEKEKGQEKKRSRLKLRKQSNPIHFVSRQNIFCVMFSRFPL